MVKMGAKTLLRGIAGSLGRYMAILAITALGVGFFAGLKISKRSMVDEYDRYVSGHGMYDFMLISSLGFTDVDTEAILGENYIRAAEGSFSADALVTGADGTEKAYKFHTLTRKINKLKTIAGRMPQSGGECIADAAVFGENDIGKKIMLSKLNNEQTAGLFAYDEYTITGIADSPLYISSERGTTSLGNGTLSGFIYLTKDGISADYYTEIYTLLEQTEYIYSDSYAALTDRYETDMKALCEERAALRRKKLQDDARSVLNENRDRLESEKADVYGKLDAAEEELEAAAARAQTSFDAVNGAGLLDEAAVIEGKLNELKKALAEIKQNRVEADADFAEAERQLDDAEAEIAAVKKPVCYALTREANTGYAAFENDTEIVSGIANVFPFFFFFVAVLVCITSMTRMVDEERIQIGILRAIGYGPFAVASKYILYAGSAALIGWGAGYTLGTWLIPQVLWIAYGIMYNISDLTYIFDPVLAAVTLAAALAGSAGAAVGACFKEMAAEPSHLIRPRSPKPGKRNILERIPFLWNRLSFLHKVSVRNVLRYKKRFIMILTGIGGCTALLVAGFGIRDSVSDVVNYQYDEIMLYDIEACFTVTPDRGRFYAGTGLAAADCLFAQTGAADIGAGGKTISATMISPESDNIGRFFSLRTDSGPLAFPDRDGALINTKTAEELDLEAGDNITVRSNGTEQTILEVQGIFDNYIGNYVFVSPDTFPENFGSCGINTVFIRTANDMRKTAAEVMKYDGVASVFIKEDMRQRISDSMSAIDYVVWLIVICAGSLSFIVLYNLTNINIAERIREIATIKVLGFYPAESAAYVFRENIILTVLGGAFGLLLGKWFHAFVMSMIKVNIMYFDVRISVASYMYAVFITFLFTLTVNIVMYFRLDRIKMAESLKTVE
jgi:ABC-type antimicrobial peptide transport system permease subunit